MVFDTMRAAHARCPTYVVAGLILMSILLTCNWWSLSMQNYELLKQMDDMGDQINICSDEKVICSGKKNGLESDLQIAERRLNELKVSSKLSEADVKKMKVELTGISRAADKSSQALTYCQAELESLKKVDVSKSTTLAAMRLDKEAIAGQLMEAKEKIIKLESSLKISSKSPMITKNIGKPNLQISSSTPSNKKEVEQEQQGFIPDPFDLQDGPLTGGNHEVLNENPDDISGKL